MNIFSSLYEFQTMKQTQSSLVTATALDKFLDIYFSFMLGVMRH